MALIELIPQSVGGSGRKRNKPKIQLYPDGMLVLNHAAQALIGNPERVKVFANLPEEFEISPTNQRFLFLAPTEKGGWALSGGGNSNRRVKFRQYRLILAPLVGVLEIQKIGKSLTLVKPSK